MLLRTRAPAPSDCSTLRTHFSTLLTFIVKGQLVSVKRTWNINSSVFIPCYNSFIEATNQFPFGKLNSENKQKDQNNLLSKTNQFCLFLITLLPSPHYVFFIASRQWGATAANLLVLMVSSHHHSNSIFQIIYLSTDTLILLLLVGD